MTRVPSLAQIQAQARAKAAQVETRARQAARDLERFNEQRLNSLTCDGTRVPTQAELERLAREGADYLRRRMGY
jgi:hypothetical protein